MQRHEGRDSTEKRGRRPSLATLQNGKKKGRFTSWNKGKSRGVREERVLGGKKLGEAGYASKGEPWLKKKERMREGKGTSKNLFKPRKKLCMERRGGKKSHTKKNNKKTRTRKSNEL